MVNLPEPVLSLALPEWIYREVDWSYLYKDDESRMSLAIYLAKRNVEMRTGGPFGAAIFDENGVLISVGVNSVVAQNCSVAHAEMTAFMFAQRRLQSYRLNQNGERIILASSAQPCAMCYGASFWAGIDEMLIGASADDVHAFTDFDEGPLPADWQNELEKRGVVVKRNLLRQQACAVLQTYSQQDNVYY